MDFLRRWRLQRDLKKGRALEGEGYYEKALEVYEAVVESTTGDERAEVMRRLGHCALRIEKLARARKALQEAVKLAPKDPDAWLLLANTCFELRDTFSADEAYHEALKHAPDRIDILYAQAEYYGLKMPRAGLEAGKRVVRLIREKPEEAERLAFPRELPLVFIRNLAAAQRLAEEALAYFEELSGEEGWIRPVAHTHKGILLANVGRYDEAIKAHLDALTADPDFDAAHFNLGMVYTRQRNFDSARAALGVYAKKHPKAAVTTFALGFLAETKPDVDEMIRLYTFFLERIKLNPPPAPSLGRLDLARGWVEHAQTVLEHARKHRDDDHESGEEE